MWSKTQSRNVTQIPTLVFIIFGAISCQDDSTPSTVTPSATSISSTTSAAPPLTRVMPLGDSITQANASHNSYRRPLWMAAESRGFRFDFVGSQSANHAGPPPHADFDTDHEGHWGWRADEILADISRWTAAYRPDLLLVHLGSNDVFQRQTTESTIAELSEIIDEVRATQPQAIFLVAQIIPTTRESANRRIRELNESVVGMAAAKTSPASPVIIVDHYSGFDAEKLTYDGVHPNEDGEAVMAERWLEAIEELDLP